MPSSRAISAIGRPLVRTNSTASRLNSGVNWRLVLCCLSGIWTASSHRRCPATHRDSGGRPARGAVRRRRPQGGHRLAGPRDGGGPQPPARPRRRTHAYPAVLPRPRDHRRAALLIATLHRINARAARKVTDEAVASIQRVAGKENILIHVTEAALDDPHGPVSQVVYPAAGGVETLEDLRREFRSKGSTFKQHQQRVFKASYTNHYRKGLIELLEALEFGSTNTQHAPVMEALELIRRYKTTAGATQYYARGEHVPVDGVVPAELAELMYRTDKRGRQRILRSVHECGAFQTVRDKLRCKEIWVVGADRWRNPDEDLPADFEENREEHYAKLRKPLDPRRFSGELREELTAELAALNKALPGLDFLDIAEWRTGAITLTPLDAVAEPRNLRRVAGRFV